MQEKPPLTDIQTLRARARADIDEGAVTSGYTADRATVLRLLDESLATELVCVLRYRRHHFMARGIHSQSVAQEFLDPRPIASPAPEEASISAGRQASPTRRTRARTRAGSVPISRSAT